MSVEIVTEKACQQEQFASHPLVGRTILMAERARLRVVDDVIERLTNVWDGRLQLSEQDKDFLRTSGYVTPVFRIYDPGCGAVLASKERFNDAPRPDEVLLTFRASEAFTPKKLKKGKSTVDFSIPELNIKFRGKWLISRVMSRSIRRVIDEENSNGLSIVWVNPRGKHCLEEYYNAWVVGFRS